MRSASFLSLAWAARSRPGNSSRTTSTSGLAGRRGDRVLTRWHGVEALVHPRHEPVEVVGVGGEVAGAGDLPVAVGGAVPDPAEQKPGDVRAGDQDVPGGAELGQQPVGELRLPGAVLALHGDVAGGGQGVLDQGAVLGPPRSTASSARPVTVRGSR